MFFLYSQIDILRKDLEKAFTEKCFSCEGTGYVKTIKNPCGECNVLGVKIPRHIVTLFLRSGSKKNEGNVSRYETIADV